MVLLRVALVVVVVGMEVVVEEVAVVEMARLLGNGSVAALWVLSSACGQLWFLVERLPVLWKVNVKRSAWCDAKLFKFRN